MSRVQQIRAQIEQLTPRERAELNAWLQSWADDQWDRQMAADTSPGGKLGKLRQQAEQEAQTGQLRDWPKPPA